MGASHQHQAREAARPSRVAGHRGLLFAAAVVLLCAGHVPNAHAALVSSQAIQEKIAWLQSAIAGLQSLYSRDRAGSTAARIQQYQSQLAALQASANGTGTIVVRVTVDGQPWNNSVNLTIVYAFAGTISGTATLAFPNGMAVVNDNPIGSYDISILKGFANYFSDINFYYIPEAPGGTAFESIQVSGCGNVDADSHNCVLAANGTITYTFNFTHQALQDAIAALEARVASLTELYNATLAGSTKVRLDQAKAELAMLKAFASSSSTASAPMIVRPPVNQTVSVGQSATFSVSVSGTAPFSYQWQKNEVTISGATSASYTTPPTTTADSGSTYRVIVSNAAGSVTSPAATLTVTTGSSGCGLPGDLNGDGRLSLADVMALIRLLVGRPSPSPMV